MELNFMNEDDKDNTEVLINYLYKEIKRKKTDLFLNINETIIVLFEIFNFYFDNLDYNFRNCKSIHQIILGLYNKELLKYNNINFYQNNVKIELPLINNNDKNKIVKSLISLPLIFSQCIKKYLYNKNNKIKFFHKLLKYNKTENKIFADKIDISNQIEQSNYRLNINMIIYYGFLYNIDSNIFIGNDNSEFLYLLGITGIFTHFSNLIYDLLKFDINYEKLINTSNCNDFYYVLFKKLSKQKSSKIFNHFFGVSDSYLKDYNKEISKIKTIKEMFSLFSNIFENIILSNTPKKNMTQVDYTLLYKIFKKKKFKDKEKKKIFLKVFKHYIGIFISDTISFLYHNEKINKISITYINNIDSIKNDVKKNTKNPVDVLKIIKKYYFESLK